MSKTDREILWEIEDVWEDVKDTPEMELSPKAVEWLIKKARESFTYKDALENMESELARGYPHY